MLWKSLFLLFLSYLWSYMVYRDVPYFMKALEILFWPYFIIFSSNINICWAMMMRICALFLYLEQNSPLEKWKQTWAASFDSMSFLALTTSVYRLCSSTTTSSRLVILLSFCSSCFLRSATSTLAVSSSFSTSLRRSTSSSIEREEKIVQFNA